MKHEMEEDHEVTHPFTTTGKLSVSANPHEKDSFFTPIWF